MSTVAPRPPRPPRPPLTPAMLDSEHYIDEHIRRTRRALKLVDLSAGVITLLAALLVFLLGAAVIDQWVVPGGLGSLGRGAMFGLLVLLVAWIAWRQFIPLLRPINPVYAAHTIERNTPSLKNSLLNLLLFRVRRRNMSAKVYHALEQQAAQRLSTAPADSAVDHTALLRLGYALMLVVALCAAYAALSPKNLATSAARVLAPWSDIAAPSRVQILDIKPGDTSVARGERFAVSAEIHGARRDDAVRLRYSTNDQQLVDESIPMTRPVDGLRFEAQLPRSTDAASAGGVQQDLAYWIEAGDAHTRRFKVQVYDRPTLVVERVHYEYPAYTGIPSAEVASSGDIHGVEGTRVTIQGIANQPIKNAYIDFDADGKYDLAMTVDPAKGDRASASFTLALRPDRRTPAHPTYVLRLVTTAGRANVDPAQYRIEVTPDYAPEVRITAPEEPELQVRVDQIVPIGVEARDPDFAVQQVRLVGKSGDRELMLGELLSKNHAGRFTGMKPVVPADSQLKPGDVLEYWAEARDNRRPEANVALSDHRRLRIIGGDDKAAQQQRNQQQPGQGQQGGGQNGESNPQGGEQGGQKAGGQGQQGDQSSGQSEGEAAAAGGGGEGEGEQSEQNEGTDGQPTPGGGGQSNQKPSSGGNASGDQQDGANDGNAAAQQNSAGDNADQQQQSGDSQDNANPSAGGTQGGDNAGAKQSKVSPAGDDDGEAIERMREHFAEQDANNPQSGDNKAATGGQSANKDANQQPAGEPQDASQQPGDPNGTEQPNGEGAAAPGGQPRDKTNANSQPQNNAAADGQPQPNQQTSGDQAAGQQPEAGKPQQGAQPQAGKQAADGQSPGAEQQGELADQPQASANAGNPPANERRAPGQQEGDKSAGQPNQDNQEQPTQQGGMNRNQGDAGAGHPSDEQQGAPEMDAQQDPQKQARDKTPGSNKKTDGDKEAASGSPDKRESDSDGGQGGDATGGGEEGKGQHADAPGKGNAGQHEAADQGAGKSNQQGEGETGDQAGDQQTADGQTGQSSGDKPGAGSQQGAASDQNAGAAGRAGESASAGGAQGDNTQQPGQQPNQESTNAQPSAEPNANQQAGEGASGQNAASNPAEQTKPADAKQQDGQPQDKPTDASGQPGGASGQQPQGGGTSHGAYDGPQQPDNPEQEDEANLEFARQQTDLVLERLDDQLGKKKVDRDLLNNLGWNEDELRRFVARWQGLKSRAAADETTKQDLDDALRSLGLRKDGPQQFRAAATKDKIRDLNEGYRSRAPLEYADRVRAYVKGAATQDAE